MDYERWAHMGRVFKQKPGEAEVVHPEGPHLEGRRPETSRASGE